MPTRNQQQVTFSRLGDVLVRLVLLKSGREYRHTCDVATYKGVIHAYDESRHPTTNFEIAENKNLAFTKVHVAGSFLTERGLLGLALRRSYPLAKTFIEDALTEFYALPDESQRTNK